MAENPGSQEPGTVPRREGLLERRDEGGVRMLPAGSHTRPVSEDESSSARVDHKGCVQRHGDGAAGSRWCLTWGGTGQGGQGGRTKLG